MTEERIRKLARDLEPVKPIPRLRTVGGILLACWAVALVIDVLVGGPMPRAASDPIWTSPSYLAAVAAAALIALGATSAALGSSVPGREETVRAGLRVTALGAVFALASWGLGVVSAVPDHKGDEWVSILSCGSRALAIGLVPALACGVFAARAWLRGARLTAALALAGGGGLGAFAVQVSCASSGVYHQLFAHTLTPLWSVALLTAPAALLIGRWARRG